MRIADLDTTDELLLEKLARLTRAAGSGHAPNWLPTMDDALEEVFDATQPGHVTRGLLDDDKVPLGWVSIVHTYGAVWEIHPLVVEVKHQHNGHSARLLADIEVRATSRGAGVLFVSTSDEIGATSIRARLVEALERGYPYGCVDTFPTSEPLLRKRGFEPITWTQPLIYQPRT